jgi:hypothetical protein
MNTDDGALYVPLTGDSKQFIGAIDEAERRVKGFSSATVAEGKKIDKAFEDLARKVRESKEYIAATESEIKKMESMLKTVAPGSAKVDLMGELSMAKRALGEEKGELAKLEAQVNATAAAHVTLRTQLRQMKEELVAMEAAGKRGTAEYAALQKRFADLTNAMGDAQKQANILANDERGMQGLIMGFSGLTGAASAAQGAIGLFSGENENLHKIMLKVQSLMAITIGLQQVQVTLNKDSAFMIVTVSKAKDMLAAAELRFATALGISNVAAKALMATLTLGLSVAIGVAIAAISRLVNKAQEARKATQEFNKATAEAAYKSLSSFEQMRLQWNSLGSDMSAKNKFIKDNKEAFEDLGVQINGVNEAENIFSKNTEAFRSALMERAKALASAELAQETYKKYLEKDLEARSMPATRTTSTTMVTAGEVQMGPVQTTTSTEYRDKWLKTQNEANDLLGKFNELMTGSIEHEKNYRSALDGLGIKTTENLEKIALLEQKISEQERLMLEAAEKGNKAEVKAIQDKIAELKEELRLRNLLVNALYAQSRANDVITNMQSGAWQPAGAPAGSIGAPSTGGKTAGARYWQTPVFDFESAKKTLAVMDQQAANARNAEAIAKKKKKTDEEAKKIADDELEVRLQIADAITQTVGAMQSAGLVSEQTANLMRDLAKGFEQMLTGNFIGFIATTISQMIIAFSGMLDSSETKAEQLNRQIEEMNELLEYQERLISRASRLGGERDARQETVDILTKQYEDLAAQLEHYQAELAKFEGRKVIWAWEGNPGEAKDMIEELTPAVEEARQALEDAKQSLNDLLTGGVTQNTIADSIAEGFRSGKASVRDFADYMNNILLDAVTRVFSTRILGEQINNITELIASSIESDGTLTDDEIAKIKADYQAIVDKYRDVWDGLTEGLNTGDNDATLKGAIKGITEETAGVLAGQVNAMRINQVEGVLLMRQQLAHLAEIALNTRYNRYLASIDSRLAAMSADNLRAQGLNG